MNDKAVYRTAPATPGMLNIFWCIKVPQDGTKYEILEIYTVVEITQCYMVFG